MANLKDPEGGNVVKRVEEVADDARNMLERAVVFLVSDLDMQCVGYINRGDVEINNVSVRVNSPNYYEHHLVSGSERHKIPFGKYRAIFALIPFRDEEKASG